MEKHKIDRRKATRVKIREKIYHWDSKLRTSSYKTKNSIGKIFLYWAEPFDVTTIFL